jgi:adenine phosphoribosyltransferase
MSQQDIYPIEIAGVKRDLRLFEVKPGLRIAIINILGDVELVEACANELAKRLQGLAYDTILTAETKSIPIAHMLSRATGVPYVVLRKNWKPYMGDAIRAETLSITTGKPQTLILDQKDIPLIQNKRVIILDDVISTGSTLQGMKLITEKAGGEVVKEVAILTEGDPSQWHDVLALGHLPLFTD